MLFLDGVYVEAGNGLRSAMSARATGWTPRTNASDGNTARDQGGDISTEARRLGLAPVPKRQPG